jgi:hypothetical protein
MKSDGLNNPKNIKTTTVIIYNEQGQILLKKKKDNTK